MSKYQLNYKLNRNSWGITENERVSKRKELILNIKKQVFFER